jgi:Carboxypeptidase regulatory-like domain
LTVIYFLSKPNNRVSRLLYCGLAVSLLFAFCFSLRSLHAQAVGGGQIQGLVTDSTGSAVPGATVSITQTESGLKRTVTSGSDGGYLLPNLPVGPYQLLITSNGFDTYQQSGIIVQVGNNLRIDVSLKVGEVSQTVQVDANASMVQTEDQSVSQVIDQKRIIDLPLNGRQATQLILLTGAAATAPAGDLVGSKNYPSSVALSVAGSQGTTINYLMDGVDNNDSFTNVNLPFPFPDALQEFSVQTSGLSAQYGLHPGAVVNIVTKSGTNQFHGTLFDFFRNGDMNARNYFSVKRDSLKRNQFGGTIGGPVVHNKLFFFFGYQGTQTRQETNAVTSFVPTQAMLNGDFSAFDSASCQSNGQAKILINPATGQPFPDNQIPVGSFNQSALALTKYLPVASNPCGKLVYGIPEPQSENQYIGHVDWNASPRQIIFARYFFTHFTQSAFFGGNLLLTANSLLDDQAQALAVGHTFTISSNLVNSFRASATRNAISRGAPADLINPSDLGIQISTPVKNYLYASVSGDFAAACGTCETYAVTTDAYNIVDDVFWTKKIHHVTFGVNYIHNHLTLDGTNTANGQFLFNGSFTGDAMADFMLGDLQTFRQANDTASDFKKNYVAGYLQDSIQATPRLTINAGIRWESDLPEIETNGRGTSFSMANFTSGAPSTVFPNAPAGLVFKGDRGVPRGFFNAHYDHFEPRIGFAFDPGGKGQESIRGSYTVGFQTPIVYLESDFENMSPWGGSLSITNPSGGFTSPYAGYAGGNPFPLPFPPTAANAVFPVLGQYDVFPTNLKPSYTQTWNLSLEKQFLENWEATISYLGNHVLHIWTGNALNPAVYIPGTCNGAPCSTTNNTDSRRRLAQLNPARGAYFSAISQEYDGANGNYNGVLVSVTHRFAKYYTLLTNYTYSHCLSAATDTGDLGGPVIQDPANPQAEYSNCGFDIRHNFVTSLVLRSSVEKKGSLLRSFLNGWQLAPIITATSGSPFTPLTGVDRSLTGVEADRPNLNGNPYLHGHGPTIWLNPASFSYNTAGNYGNTRPYSLYGPGYFDLDGAVTKYLPLPRTWQLEVRAECFNCMNHANLQNPSATYSSSNTFGVITTANPPRILQLSLKTDF